MASGSDSCMMSPCCHTPCCCCAQSLHYHTIAFLPLQFGFQVTRKESADGCCHQSDQPKPSARRRHKARADLEDAIGDVIQILPHVLLLIIGTACVLRSVQRMAHLDPVDGELRLAYVINMCQAVFVLVGLWPPVGQILNVQYPPQLLGTRASPSSRARRLEAPDDSTRLVHEA